MNPTGVKRITTGYSPRPLQAHLHRSLKRFNVIVCHRRFGKTVFAINETLDRALRCKLKRPQFAYLAPTYGQAKRVAWDYFKEYALKIPGSESNEADLRIEIPRPAVGDSIRFMLLGAENPMALKGIYLDGVTLDEYAEMNPVVWGEVIRPTLSDRSGWANFIGTPKGQNNFYKMRQYALEGNDPEWFTALYRASETGILPESELRSARAQMTEDEYLQEYECDFNAGIAGAYFAKELSRARSEGRIRKIPHDPMLPVDLYFDLGINDVSAAWFIQTHRGLHRAIDYYEVSGHAIPDLVKAIKERPYNFGEWVFPHDAQVRDFSTGKARLQTFQSLGCRPARVVPRVGTKAESIQAARMILKKCEFDEEKCKRGIEALENYQKKWDAKTQTFAETPLHNWASNGADAFQQFAMGVRDDGRDSFGHGIVSARPGTEIYAEGNFNPFRR